MKRATILATAISLFGSFGANAEPLRATMPPFNRLMAKRQMLLNSHR